MPSLDLLNYSEKKEKSERLKKTSQEYMDARTLHDRFCKFEVPFNPARSIQSLQAIQQLIDVSILKTADLPFKLNSLNWFLTPDGKKFLVRLKKRHEFDKKKAALDLDQIILG